MKDKLLYAGGAAVAVGAIVAALLLRPLPDAGPTPETGAPQAETAVTDVPETGGTGTAATEADIADAAPSAQATDAPADANADDAALSDADMAEPEAAADAGVDAGTDPQPTLPELTNMRIESDGLSVIFGRGEPGSLVDVLVDGVKVDQVTADAGGVFQAYPNLGYSDRPRMMEFVQDPGGADLRSAEAYVIHAVPAPATSDPAPDTDADTTVAAMASEDVTDEAAPAPETEGGADDHRSTDMDPVEAENPSDSGTQPVLAVGEDGVRVVQPAIEANPAPEVMSAVALDAITYEATGDVVLTGRAPTEGFVRVYVDNTAISTLPVDENGTWRTDLPSVDTGVYTLRIDEVDATGAVVSRIETPFLREDPETVVAAITDQADGADQEGQPPAVSTLTVQPGNTLWAIAEERYGSGMLFVSVFEANQDRIRDPDLIYPGQVFELPEIGE